MRLGEFLDTYVADNQYLHIECIGVGEIVYDGTKAELLAEYSDLGYTDTTNDLGDEVDITWLWVHLVEAIDNILYITIQY